MALPIGKHRQKAAPTPLSRLICIPYDFYQVDRENSKVQILNWTFAEWLDVVEIEFKKGQEQGTEAEVRVAVTRA